MQKLFFRSEESGYGVNFQKTSLAERSKGNKDGNLYRWSRVKIGFRSARLLVLVTVYGNPGFHFERVIVYLFYFNDEIAQVDVGIERNRIARNNLLILLECFSFCSVSALHDMQRYAWSLEPNKLLVLEEVTLRLKLFCIFVTKLSNVSVES